MEVSAKGGGWGGGQHDEGGRWVSRKKGSRWVGVGRSFPKKKNLGSGVGQNKSNKKTVPRQKKLSSGKKSSWEKKEQKKKIILTN